LSVPDHLLEVSLVFHLLSKIVNFLFLRNHVILSYFVAISEHKHLFLIVLWNLTIRPVQVHPLPLPRHRLLLLVT
jgi:hypothetical protein